MSKDKSPMKEVLEEELVRTMRIMSIDENSDYKLFVKEPLKFGGLIDELLRKTVYEVNCMPIYEVYHFALHILANSCTSNPKHFLVAMATDHKSMVEDCGCEHSKIFGGKHPKDLLSEVYFRMLVLMWVFQDNMEFALGRYHALYARRLQREGTKLTKQGVGIGMLRIPMMRADLKNFVHQSETGGPDIDVKVLNMDDLPEDVKEALTNLGLI